MQLKTNSTLQSGKYRIIRVLGQGGFGITYLAENTFFEKKVAIKEFFPKDFCGRDNTSHLTLGTQNNAETVAKLKERFIKEAKNIAKLDHPGIVKIHDIFEENNTAYYVMDYIEGENLNEIVKRNGPLSEAKAIDYIIKVGEALEYIHSRKMTHFDVKPANIVVRHSDDRPILIDFGLSKQFDIHGDATSTLMQGVSHGYSPIELYNAGAITSFSPQTDVYSLGASLYYLITGKTPPAASELLENGLTLPIWTPNYIEKTLRQAMSPHRKNRQISVSAFLDSLCDSYSTLSNEDTRIIETIKDVHSDYHEPQNPKSQNKAPVSNKQKEYYNEAISVINFFINEAENELIGGKSFFWLLLISLPLFSWAILERYFGLTSVALFIYAILSAAISFPIFFIGWHFIRAYIIRSKTKRSIRVWIHKNPSHPYAKEMISMFVDNLDISTLMNPYSYKRIKNLE